MTESTKPSEPETRVLGQAVVESPRNLLWLAVLPAAAATDVLVVAPTVILYELATDTPFVEIYTE